MRWGDKAPEEIVAGARQAFEKHGIPVVLVGDPGKIQDPGELDIIPAMEAIPMDAEPGSSVRKMKDSSLVRAAEAVRDGRASAMVSAGNTGATMASALLRMGRIKGVARPAIATLIPTPGSTSTVFLMLALMQNAGPNGWFSSPRWAQYLLAFGLMLNSLEWDFFRLERNPGRVAHSLKKLTKKCPRHLGLIRPF